MNTDEKLAHGLVWDADGHLSEVAATAAADGQDHLLPEAALAHLSECESCMRRVGQAAMLAIDVGEQLVAIAPGPAAARAPVPTKAIVAALVLAALGAMPALSSASIRIVRAWNDVMVVVPHVLRAVVALARSGTDAVGPVVWAAALLSVVVLLLTGIAIARVVPRIPPADAARQEGG